MVDPRDLVPDTVDDGQVEGQPVSEQEATSEPELDPEMLKAFSGGESEVGESQEESVGESEQSDNALKAFEAFAKQLDPNATPDQVQRVLEMFNEFVAQKLGGGNEQQKEAEPTAEQNVPSQVTPEMLDEALSLGGQHALSVIDAIANERANRLVQQAMSNVSALMQQQYVQLARFAEQVSVLASLASQDKTILEYPDAMKAAIVHVMKNGVTDPYDGVMAAYEKFKNDYAVFQKIKSAPNRIDVRPKNQVSTKVNAKPVSEKKAAQDENNIMHLFSILKGNDR